LIARKWTYARRPADRGVLIEIRELIVRMATENPTWATRIQGALQNVGQRVGRSTFSTRRMVAVRWSSFGAGREGVYYVPCDSSSNPPVHVMDLETGRDWSFGVLESPTARPLGLSVSPDGKSIVYPRLTYLNRDLMLIENFR
jgi:hypothetical protein